jgi:hypothetical protein
LLFALQVLFMAVQSWIWRTHPPHHEETHSKGSWIWCSTWLAP